ncbi:DUF418 domain-containing protein [Flammeovirga kamogawensis]|uniref:DUF418 domain-containing protein n=1 Tax=Flammeovirga kamogawensis TaxID=373891 RepID=A0ABX8H2B4_9BACT|nr:DUF418 domain-containing protein [Flammeovirga kamogawensis]MBB6460236.1 uncharacterized protein [Flammeovirga kamogawensis]QWG10048.1 DUF418 domain-containing protein [Flammeovirga kamogawensis]
MRQLDQTLNNFTPTKKKRLDVIDVLRGFAVMIIMLLHNIEHFNYYHYPMKTVTPDWLIDLDANVFSTMFFLFGGKTYSIFALLFGFTFYLMYEKQKQLGKDFGYRYLWRLFLLSIFAAFNSIFFAGEVLLMYAITGLILFLERKFNAKVILIIACFLLFQPLEWYRYFNYLVVDGYTIGKNLSSDMWLPVQTYLGGESMITTFYKNISLGQTWSFMWALENGRVIQTAGLFSLGFYFGKVKLFEGNSTKKWLTILISAAVISIPLFFLKETYLVNQSIITLKRTLGVTFDMWWKLSFTFIWVSSIILLYRYSAFQKLTKYLKAYGRMSLTNYITQSMVGGFIYYGYGLNWADKYGVTISLGIGLVLLIVQITICNWWIKKYKQGPFEKLWHHLTWAPKF